MESDLTVSQHIYTDLLYSFSFMFASAHKFFTNIYKPKVFLRFLNDQRELSRYTM